VLQPVRIERYEFENLLHLEFAGDVWKHTTLLNCCADKKTCCLGMWCPCLLRARTRYRAGFNHCCYGCFSGCCIFILPFLVLATLFLFLLLDVVMCSCGPFCYVFTGWPLYAFDRICSPAEATALPQVVIAPSRAGFRSGAVNGTDANAEMLGFDATRKFMVSDWDTNPAYRDYEDGDLMTNGKLCDEEHGCWGMNYGARSPAGVIGLYT
jgi:hypothetical protein